MRSRSALATCLMSLIIVLSGCGTPPTPMATSGAPKQDLTALQAVRLALEPLRAQHPLGGVGSVGASHDQLGVDGRAREWIITIWDPSMPGPEGGLLIFYRVRDGVLGPPSARSTTRVKQPLVAFSDVPGQDPLAPILDSNEAVLRATPAGGDEFVLKTGGVLFNLDLRRGIDGHAAWRVYYQTLREQAGTEPLRGFVLWVDALSGATQPDPKNSE